jgi:hypothetical protein
MAAPRSRRHLRRCVPAPGRQHGHRRGGLQSVQPLAKSVCGETDRIPPTRVSRPRDRPRRPASPPSAGRVSDLLSWGPNASRLREGCAGDATRSDAHRRARGRVPGSGRLTSSLRTTRSRLTGTVDRRLDVNVSLRVCAERPSVRALRPLEGERVRRRIRVGRFGGVARRFLPGRVRDSE